MLDLTNPTSRENALLELSKKRESFPELAPYLWHSFGTISALLQVRLHLLVPTRLASMHRRLLMGVPVIFSVGDCLDLPAAVAPVPDSARLQQSVQCACTPAMRGLPPGDAQPFPAR